MPDDLLKMSSSRGLEMSGLSKPPKVLFVCSRGLAIDGVFPIGLIQAANLIRHRKKGLFYFQLSPESIKGVQAIVIHLHWDFNFFYI